MILRALHFVKMEFLQNFTFGEGIEKLQTKREIRKFTLFLYQIPRISRSSVQNVIKYVDSILSKILVPCLARTIEKELPKCDPLIIAKIHRILRDSDMLFAGLKDEDSRFAVYENESLFTYPTIKKLGEIRNTRVTECNKTVDIYRDVFEVHVPIS